MNYIFLVLSLKRNGPQTFRCSSSNNPFLQYICYCCNLLRWMFFILCDNWKTLLFIKVHRYSEGFSSRNVAAFFRRSILKEVRILRYLHNTVTVNANTKVQKFTFKLLLYKFPWLNLFFWLCFVTVPHFLLNRFLINSKPR